MNWIKLTRVDGETHEEEEVFVNIDHVDWMRRGKPDEDSDECTILFYVADDETNPASIDVKETPEEILSAVKTQTGTRREPEEF